MEYERPFRVGRKQNRAVVDANGIEVVVFKKGDESLANAFCDLINDSFIYVFKAYKNEEDYENNKFFIKKTFYRHIDLKNYSAKHSSEMKSKCEKYISTYDKIKL